VIRRLPPAVRFVDSIRQRERRIPPRRSTRRGAVSRLRTLVGLVVLCVAGYALYLVQSHKLSTFTIVSDSMAPALLPGQTWLMEPPVGAYETGEMVVFHPPGEPGRIVVKRVVARAGDRVQWRASRLFVNQVQIQASDGAPAVLEGEWSVGPGQLFVVGDNLDVSIDSRDYGPIPAADVSGILTHKLGDGENNATVTD
jgi:signal peptidase I